MRIHRRAGSSWTALILFSQPLGKRLSLFDVFLACEFLLGAIREVLFPGLVVAQLDSLAGRLLKLGSAVVLGIGLVRWRLLVTPAVVKVCFRIAPSVRLGAAAVVAMRG